MRVLRRRLGFGVGGGWCGSNSGMGVVGWGFGLLFILLVLDCVLVSLVVCGNDATNQRIPRQHTKHDKKLKQNPRKTKLTTKPKTCVLGSPIWH